ncbi:MAG: hypothetical protein JJT81_01350 [Rubellimicrobium sp.]|nr:hypothetical protein [Rubellimicrobium sp.]
MILSRLTTFSLAIAVSSMPALATNLPYPEGEVVLTVTGTIANTNDDGSAHFDLAMLAAIEPRETVTDTPWHDGTPTFSGPLAAALIDAVGATGTTLRITALNEYVVDVPVSDLRDYPAIFATHLDGVPMPVRNKGPLFLIFPFAEYPELVNEVYFGRSAWQIRHIEVLLD